MGTKDKLAVAVKALKTIQAGSEVAGRWIDQDTYEAIDGYDTEATPPRADVSADAVWEPYTEDEQHLWLASVADIAAKALKEIGE